MGMIDVNIFVSEFMHKYDKLINKIARKYLIPNRYTIDDIKQYISERIIKILSTRNNDIENKIENPEKYFKSCLDFYCIEYQRMHGFIFDLPKRPRKNCEIDEKSARSYGFKYFGDMTIEEENSLQEFTLEKTLSENQELGPETIVWSSLTGLLLSEEAQVLGCIYMRNMTWAETSDYLGVAQSTCWFRKNRAIKKIYEHVESMSGLISENIKNILRGNTLVDNNYEEEDY
jgi:RNA polymerase sigma factor (sigma-70 family)